MARQLENKFFLYENYLEPQHMIQDMIEHKEMWKKKYSGKCRFKRVHDKNGVRIIVEEQMERKGEER